MYALYRFRGFFSLAAIAFALVAAAMPSASAAGTCGNTYTIQGGDTLARIARKCGESVPAILAANDQIDNPSRLRVGWTIRMPGRDAANTAEPDSATPSRVVGVSGQIVNSRRCAQLHTPDGEIYGLVSPKVLFRSGAVVKVSGSFARRNECNAERTIVVSELQPTR